MVRKAGTRSRSACWSAKCRTRFRRPEKFVFALLPLASIPAISRSVRDAFGYGMPYPRVIPHSDGAGRVDQLGAAFPLNGWAVPCGVTEPSRIVRLVRPRSLQSCPWIRLLLCRKACRWSKAPVLAYPVSRRTEPFMLQVCEWTHGVGARGGRFRGCLRGSALRASRERE